MLEFWMILALGTALSWAIVDVTDKYLVDKFVKNPYVIVCISGLVNLFFGLAMFQFQIISVFDIFICFFIALTNLLFVMAYLKAFQIEEVSRVVPLFQVSVMFVVMMAFLFLGERLTLTQYGGIFLLMAGALLVSLRKRISLSKGALLGLAAAFLSAINFILMDYAQAAVGYQVVFAYSRILFFIVTTPFFLFAWKDIKYSIQKGGKVFLSAASFAEAVNALGFFLMVWAFSMGSVSLVNAVVATEPFMVLAMTIFLTMFFPHFIKEEIDRDTIIYKVAAIIMIFIGVWMIG
jgi:uncharacterized membrane protein